MTKGIEANAETKATTPSAMSPEALLKAAVSGAREPEKPATPVPARKPVFALDARLGGLIAGTLAVGLMLGAGATALTVPRGDRSVSAFAEVNAGLEANRLEASRLNTEIERLGKTLAGLRDASEGRRNELKSSNSGVTERLAKLEQILTAKLTGIGERVDQAEREQGARLAALTTQVEKRAASAPAPQPVAVPQPVAAAPAPTPAAAPKPEPSQTGSINDAKAKPAPVENWAVRDVYDGTAILEDRRRRLVEVGPGDTVPGIGRVEAVERRGRQWVVVTRQGVITPQSW
jgi:flagellar motility protein MotE (MotC chaperone)